MAVDLEAERYGPLGDCVGELTPGIDELVEVLMERLELPASEPGSAAILGLAGEEKTGARPLLFLRAPGARANGLPANNIAVKACSCK